MPAGTLSAWEFINTPDDYSRYRDKFALVNYLRSHADLLENRHGIKTIIYIEKEEGDFSVSARGKIYFEKMGIKKDEKVILIWASPYKKKGKILVSEPLKELFPQKYVNMLEKGVLNSLQGKWYINERKLLAKVLGTFVYMAENYSFSERDRKILKGRYIEIDNKLYAASLAPVFDDIIWLFYFEPISFVIYFPFIMYFIIVRVIGFSFGRNYFELFNVIWLGLMIFIFVLIINRINILYPEYVAIVTLVLGLTTPVYVYFFILYRDELGAAAYNYFHEVTGGFDTVNAFEGKEWRG